jgi:hypothetical protein
MADIEWMDGLRIFPPNDKAPDFVKGDIVINPEQAIAWLKKQDGTVRLELKTKKSDGSLYATVKQKPQRQGSADDYRAMKEGYNTARQQQQGRNQTNEEWLNEYGEDKPLPRASFPPNFTKDYEDDIPF